MPQTTNLKPTEYITGEAEYSNYQTLRAARIRKSCFRDQWSAMASYGMVVLDSEPNNHTDNKKQEPSAGLVMFGIIVATW